MAQGQSPSVTETEEYPPGGQNQPQSLVIGLGPVPAEVVEPVLGSGIRFEPNPDEKDRLQAEGAIMRAAPTVGAADLDGMPALRVIARTGVGFENVDIAAAADRGVAVCITPGSNTNAVAEGAIAHLLHLVKSLGTFTDIIRRGGWEERENVPIGDLEGSTLGIIGFGRIGRRVAQLAQAFGMTILAHDEMAEVPDEFRADLPKLLRLSDAVTLHLPLLESTRHIIDSDALETMRCGAILLNVSRGGLIDEDAVLTALESGKLGGLGLDAFDPEPPHPYPLYQHPRTVLTPHILGLSKNAARRSFVMAAQVVRDVLDGQEPTTAVTPQ